MWVAGVGLAFGSAVAAAVLCAAGTPVAHADTDDPAVFAYSQDPSNLFSPVVHDRPDRPGGRERD
ncbi:MAG: hypothetical protein B7W97_00230 [Mycobacterium sp. 20-66-4]|nr:MAG: hypothetical protein B7W97_00230 [Mycobacterium sp. 20-66-4]